MNINKRFLTSAIIGTVVGGCVCSYPTVLRWQVEKRLPGIEFDDVSMSTSGITLSGVKLDKGWIKGELNTVTSDFSRQNVTIDGGSLNVNLNDKQNRDGIKQQKRDIQFKDLNVNVVYKEYVATLDGVKSEQDRICFTTAKLKNPELTASGGCFNKDKKTNIHDKYIDPPNTTDFGIMRNGAGNIDYITLIAKQTCIVRVVLEDRVG